MHKLKEIPWVKNSKVKMAPKAATTQQDKFTVLDNVGKIVAVSS
jgi:hypothetical protein